MLFIMFEIILKYLYLPENSLYEKPVFLLEPTRGPVSQFGIHVVTHILLIRFI